MKTILATGAAITLITVLYLVAIQPVYAEGDVGSPTEALKGVATHYDAPTIKDAAAGPALRKALGSDWRGRYVTVRANGHLGIVRLSDFCACMDRPDGPTLLDLDKDMFERFAPLSQGVVSITVEWENGPVPTAPPTDISESRPRSDPAPWWLVLAVVTGGAWSWRRFR